MASITWNNTSSNWMTASDWSGGVLPGSGDSVSFAGTGTYICTLYNPVAIANLSLNDAGAQLYDAGRLTVSGTTSLAAGTLALEYGTLAGGTLALTGGTLQSNGGTLAGVSVQGSLTLSAPLASLYVTGGLTMSGSGGSSFGALSVSGQYDAVDFVGSQSVVNAYVTLGAQAAGPNQGGPAALDVETAYGATAGSTLTLASSVWLAGIGTQAVVNIGGSAPTPFVSTLLGQGIITETNAGGTLDVTGSGNFINQGVIGVSNGGTLEIACGGFSNTGTITVSNATLDFGGTYASARLSSLGKYTLTSATVRLDGTVQNAGSTLTIGAGSALGPLELAGTIAGGTVVDTGGGLNLSAGTGVLAGVTYQGSLTLAAGAALTLEQNTTLSGPVSVTGAGAALQLEGQTTLNATSIALGSATGVASIATTDPWLASAATTATLGPALVITQAGAHAALIASGQTPVFGYGLSDTLILQGTINAGVAGGNFSLGGPGSIINQGKISVTNGDTLVVGAATFSNTGTIAVGAGATAILGGPANIFGVSPAWTNSGVIAVNGGSLVLSGAVHTAQLGSITSTGGSISVTGTLQNAGSTLSLGSTLPGFSLAGTITGGTISDPNGLLAVAATKTAVLSGVTYQGKLIVGAGATVVAEAGLSLSGTAFVTGSGAALDFQGDQSFDKALVLLGATGGATLDVRHDPGLSAGSTLTLGPNLTLDQAGGLAMIGSTADQANDAIISYAAINASSAGATLAFSGSNFTNEGTIAVSNGETLSIGASNFSNAGAISISNAALVLSGDETLSGLGSLTTNNAAVSVTGTLNAAGGTLSIGAGSAWGRVALSGSISGGVIADGGFGLAAQGGTLSGVTYMGTLDLSRPFQTLSFSNGLNLTDGTGTQPGTVMLTGAQSSLIAVGSQTLDNATVYLGCATQTYFGQSIAPPELAASGGTTLTLGSNLTIRSDGIFGYIGNAAIGNWTDAIVNDGTIISATPGDLITLGSSFFTNNGVIAEGNYGNMLFGGVEMFNTGTIAVSPGSNLWFLLYDFFAAPNAGATVFSNSGTLRMLGGVVTEVTGSAFPTVPIVNTSSGLIQGLGLLNTAVVNNGLIEGKYGPVLVVGGAITGSGTIQIDTGCRVELEGAVAASQTVTYTATGETLQLDQASSFSAAVAGFGSGDLLDINNTPVSAVAITAGTLTLTTAQEVFRLDTTSALAGEVSVGNDGHGGSLVSYLAQAASGAGGVADITVSQPQMLFWASAVGDEFQGATANFNAAQFADFTSASSLDFTDLALGSASLSYTQNGGVGALTVTDGTHSASLSLLGSFTASGFHLSSDGHGGTLITHS